MGRRMLTVVCARAARCSLCPWRSSPTGIIAALIAMIIVALATIYTVELLMAQATATGMHDYSTLSTAVGGRWYKVRAHPLTARAMHACSALVRRLLLLMHAA